MNICLKHRYVEHILWLGNSNNSLIKILKLKWQKNQNEMIVILFIMWLK